MQVRGPKPDATEYGPNVMVMTSEVFGNWIARVPLTDTQAIIAFPKFGTIGIGFEKETDWNTNLPYSCDYLEIYNHIKHNKGDTRIRKAKCLDAIRALQTYAASVRQK